MEIQDRNSLIQILTGAREGGFAFSSSEKDVFAEVLKSTQQEVSCTPKDIREVEVKQVLKEDDFAIKSAEEKNINKKDSPKKAEADNVKNADAKKKSESKKAKDDNVAVGVNQVPVQNNVEDKTTVQTEKSGAEISENIVDGEVFEPGTQEVLFAPIIDGVFDSGLMQNIAVSEIETVGVDQSEDVAILVADGEVAGALPVEKEQFTEGVDLISEDEALLVEQAKYFDDKIASDKKLKIEVNVSEEKIAEPVIKDVLKNRFEVDALFQSVENEVKDEVETDMLLPNSDLSTEETLVMNDKNDIKNVLFNEVRVVSENVSTSDANLISVSGKEIAGEYNNVTKNEAFAKINETSVRDNFKGVSKEVIEQIKVNITKSAVKGVDTIDIQLKPEDLGKIQIKMLIGKDGKVQAEIIASRAETADMLQKDASALSKAFNDAGYDTDSKSFTFSFQNENQAKGQEKNDSGLLKFIGEKLEQEAESVAGNDNVNYDPVLGLNIRV